MFRFVRYLPLPATWLLAIALILCPLTSLAGESQDEARSVLRTLVGDGGMPAFYDFDKPVPPSPGTLLRQEPLEPEYLLQNAESGKRVLYSSTDGIDGVTPVVVSGAVMFPRGEPPQGGWPVVAWAHGTVGVADICAPSVNRRSLRDRDYLNAYLAAGYAIVASDYQGLGTVGPHPYMTMRPVGYSVLDNVRAALKTYPQLANKIFLIGHSQGSQAAISAAVEALGYAPEVNVLGTVATGLAASIIEDHPAPAVAAVWPVQKEGDYIGSAVMMMQYAGTYPAIDPHFDYRPFMSPRTAPLFELTQTSCPFYMGNELAKYVNSHEIRIPEVFPGPLPTELRQRLEKHMYFSFEQARISQPVFTGSGLADSLAPVANHYNFISAMCYQGTTVDWHYYDGESHSSAVIRSQPDALAFMEKLLNGERVESNCANLREPGPIQTTKPGLPY